MIRFIINYNNKNQDIKNFLENNDDRVKVLIALRTRDMIMERFNQVFLTKEEENDIKVVITITDESEVHVNIMSPSIDVLNKINPKNS